MEFALVTPVIAVLVVALFDASKAMILRREVINAARNISLTASLLAVQADAATTLTEAQVQRVESDVFAEMPWLRGGNEKGTTSVTLSGIEFSAAPGGRCKPYTTCREWSPYVAWSVAYRPTNTYGVDFVYPVRQCGRMESGVLNIDSVENTRLTAANLMTSLRTGGIAYPDPIVVADVRYSYTPAFFRFIVGPIDFVASTYWPVRTAPFDAAARPGDQIGSGELTTYDLAGTDTNAGAHCVGLP